PRAWNRGKEARQFDLWSRRKPSSGNDPSARLATYSRPIQCLRLSRDPPAGDWNACRAGGTDDPRIDDRHGDCDDSANAQVRRYGIRLSLPRVLGPRISPSRPTKLSLCVLIRK